MAVWQHRFTLHTDTVTANQADVFSKWPVEQSFTIQPYLLFE